MGFQNNNTSGGKPTYFMKIKTEKNDKEVITGKFFSLSKKVDNTWVDELQKINNQYAAPFYGFLKDIKMELDKKIKKKDGTEIPLPTIKFNFYDKNANYILDLPFCNDKGRITSDIFNLLNSMANIDQFGMIKLYIIETTRADGKKDFSVNLRNAKNWTDSSDYSIFKAPEDKSKIDHTKVSWKYKYDEIPKHTVEKEIEGEMVTIVQEKKHKDFFIKMITDDILPKLTTTQYNNQDDNSPGVNLDQETSLQNDDMSDDLPF